MVRFEILNKNGFIKTAERLFSILANNMAIIAPTGNIPKEDYAIWLEAVGEGIKKEARNIVLIYLNDTLVGFFQYYITDELFMMEEIQITPEYQGKQHNIFKKLFGFIFSILPPTIKIVEAYANKENQKSQEILHHLGLQVVGENKNGNSYHFRGEMENFLKWYNAVTAK